MAEWDRLESRLKDLEAAATGWVEDPMDPADLRRLGARRRRRRWVATIGAAVVIAIGGGAGVYAAGSMSQHQTPVPAGSPTLSTPPTPSEGDSPEPDATGSLIETKTAKAQGRSEPIPPSSRGWTRQPTSTPDTPAPTQPETPTSTPSPTEEPESPGPEPSQTDGPAPESTAEPTEPAPPPPTGDSSTR